MASSSGSLETSAESRPPPPPPQTTYPFSFSTSSSFMSSPTASFTDLLAAGDYPGMATVRRGLSDRIAERTGSGIPKFKSVTPPSLPLSPPLISPSSYFAIPPGLSPTELLDSPVLLSSSNVLPSPTTGTFPGRSFNWMSNPEKNQQDHGIINQEDKKYSDFSFQTQSKPLPSSTNSMFHSQTAPIPSEQQPWSFQEPRKQDSLPLVKSEPGSMKSFSPEIANIQTNTQINVGNQSDYNNYNKSSLRKSDDGYNWRKYGQKQVKGSENPRSYYKCTYLNCPTKKKVEMSLDGQITEIVYKGNHNHPKPQNTRRSSSSSSSANCQSIQPYHTNQKKIQAYNNITTNEIPDHSYASHGTGQMDSVGTPENSSISIADEEFDRSSQKSRSVGDEFDEDEPDTKRWKGESENEGMSTAGNRTVREPRVVVQTTSDIDILDDGYRWRKYGQKVVKGNPNPRSYYKCTHAGCPVRKHVERASHDLRAVITTYEGKHNHDVPAARGGGNSAVNRSLPTNPTAAPTTTNNNNNAAAAAAAAAAMMHSMRNLRPPPTNSSESQAPFTLEMLQSPGNYGYSTFGNSMGSSSFLNQPTTDTDNGFSRSTKEEPRDDFFLESLLY